MRKAARERRIYHLWWHPHNFGADIEESMAILRVDLDDVPVPSRRTRLPVAFDE